MWWKQGTKLVEKAIRENRWGQAETKETLQWKDIIWGEHFTLCTEFDEENWEFVLG